MNMKNILLFILLGILIFLLTAIAFTSRQRLGLPFENLGGISTAHLRADYAKKADRENAPMEIGVVGPWSYENVAITNLLRGIELACRLYNERADTTRPIQLHIRDDQRNSATAKRQMQDFCENPAICAVIGGIVITDYKALQPLADFNQMPLISPTITPDSDLFDAVSPYCFFTYPPSTAAIEVIRAFMAQNHLQSVAILGPPQLHYGHYLCNAFDRATPRDTFGQIGIIDRVVYPIPVQPEFITETIRFWNEIITYDTLLLSGEASIAQTAFDALGRIDTPPTVILTEEITENQLAQLTIPTNLTIRLLSSYTAEKANADNLEFIRQYHKQYGEQPDSLAAQGYDALNIIAAALRASGSTVSGKIVETLRTLQFTNNVSAASGIAFNAQGIPTNGRMVLLQSPPIPRPVSR
jgi:branched-chain amino acid transport system substrate-binding protein